MNQIDISETEYCYTHTCNLLNLEKVGTIDIVVIFGLCRNISDALRFIAYVQGTHNGREVLHHCTALTMRATN